MTAGNNQSADRLAFNIQGIDQHRLNENIKSALREIADKLLQAQQICSVDIKTLDLHSGTDLSDWLGRTVRLRKLRDKYFLPELFSDPAWDILLDLAIAKAEGRRISVSSLCIAARVPTTTALRRIKAMLDEGLICQQPDLDDKRRTYVAISDSTYDKMVAYVAESMRLITGDARDGRRKGQAGMDLKVVN